MSTLLTQLPTTSNRLEGIRRFESVANEGAHKKQTSSEQSHTDAVDLQSSAQQAPTVTYSVNSAGKIDKPQLETNSLNKYSKTESLAENSTGFSITRLSQSELIEHKPSREVQTFSAIANNGNRFHMLDLYV